MEAVRSFADANRGSIINVVYVIAFLVALYYLYKFLISGSDLEVDILNNETDGNKQSWYTISKDGSVRVKTGGEYTISFWMYISDWSYRSGLAKSVLEIVDNANESNNSLLTTILYPNEAKMMVRVHTDKSDGADYTKRANFTNLMGGNGAITGGMQSPICDLQDIDLQRWINVTVSVNGRIVDVYYDGKLARSCVLPDVPVAATTGRQSVVIGRSGGFGGKVSGIQFFGYALTPDRIYSIYQGGPRGAAGFLGYVQDKLGIKINYSGAGGERQSFTI
jgi:hypothetical protein